MKASLILAAAALAAGFALPVAAQELPEACRADHRKVCPEAKSEKAVQCLKSKSEKVSVACKAALKEAQKK